MSSQQSNKDKSRSNKCMHFCFPFDVHNYCPTCRESGKGDDPCVTFETPCPICASFTEEKLHKNEGQSQSWGLTSRSTARVILGQVLSIATCGTRTHRGDSL